MRFRAHLVFSTGVEALAYALATGAWALPALPGLVLVSAVTNAVIDGLGHEGLRRSPRTHTPLRASLIGALAGTAYALVGAILKAAPLSWLWLLAWALTGMVGGLGHMLLDAVTGRGIYVVLGARPVRVGFLGLDFDDPLANGIAELVGVALIVASALLSMPRGPY